ncbi:MAG: hypothetical protein R6W66_08885 [Pelovirga sp.]
MRPAAQGNHQIKVVIYEGGQRFRLLTGDINLQFLHDLYRQRMNRTRIGPCGAGRCDVPELMVNERLSHLTATGITSA